jgi:hypothetical protein
MIFRGDAFPTMWHEGGLWLLAINGAKSLSILKMNVIGLIAVLVAAVRGYPGAWAPTVTPKP